MGLQNMEGVREIGLPPLEKSLLLSLAWKINDSRESYQVSSSWLVMTTGYSRRSVTRGIQSLEDRGHIRVQRTYMTASIYAIIYCGGGDTVTQGGVTVAHDGGDTVAHRKNKGKEIRKKKPLPEKQQPENEEDGMKLSDMNLGSSTQKVINPEKVTSADLHYFWDQSVKDWKTEAGLDTGVMIPMTKLDIIFVTNKIPRRLCKDDLGIGRCMAYGVYRVILTRWEDFSIYLQEQMGLNYHAKEPSPGFVLKYVSQAQTFAKMAGDPAQEEQSIDSDPSYGYDPDEQVGEDLSHVEEAANKPLW